MYYIKSNCAKNLDAGNIIFYGNDKNVPREA